MGGARRASVVRRAGVVGRASAGAFRGSALLLGLTGTLAAGALAWAASAPPTSSGSVPAPLSTPSAASQMPGVQTPGVQTPSVPTTPSSPASADPAGSSPASPGDSTSASEGSQVELVRKAKDGGRRVIRVVRTGTSDKTGIFTSCAPQDQDPAGSPTISVFSENGAGGVRVTVDKNVIVGALALVTQQDGGDGHIEVSDGSASYLDDVPKGPDGQPLTDRLSRCEVQASPRVTPDTVRVTQGRTRLKGSKLVYDESDGLAQISGPITFERSPNTAGGSTPTGSTLTGVSDRIEVDVDRETTTLVGNVTLKDGDRVSSAARVDYDDAANVAILRGTAEAPAKSVKPGETLVAPVIRYNLDTGSLVVLGPVTGEFQDGGGGDASPGPTGTPSVPGSMPSVPPTSVSSPAVPSVPGR